MVYNIWAPQKTLRPTGLASWLRACLKDRNSAGTDEKVWL